MKKSSNLFDEELLMKNFKEYEKIRNISNRNKIIEMNIPLVRYVVIKRLSCIDIEMDELISLGYFGLINAVEKYDVHYGTKFSTYATACILNYIKNNLNSVTDIKMIGYNYSILKAKNMIERITGIKLEDNISELDSILGEDNVVEDKIKDKLKYYLLNRDCNYNEQNVPGTYEIDESINYKMMLKKK